MMAARFCGERALSTPFIVDDIRGADVRSEREIWP
ncbi:hypothetical protein PANA5342_3361 [Pantoea ananatis LMG 5342]|nr:hypothetical protein PANA5342_3361 [Pantoea ananatis LMG 5342]